MHAWCVVAAGIEEARNIMQKLAKFSMFGQGAGFRSKGASVHLLTFSV